MFQPLPLQLVETLITLLREKVFNSSVHCCLLSVRLEAENSEKLLFVSSVICLFKINIWSLVYLFFLKGLKHFPKYIYCIIYNVYYWLIPQIDFWASSFVVMAFVLFQHCRAKQCSWDHDIIIAIYVELSQKLIKTEKYQGLLFVDIRS